MASHAASLPVWKNFRKMSPAGSGIFCRSQKLACMRNSFSMFSWDKLERKNFVRICASNLLDLSSEFLEVMEALCMARAAGQYWTESRNAFSLIGSEYVCAPLD